MTRTKVFEPGCAPGLVDGRVTRVDVKALVWMTVVLVGSAGGVVDVTFVRVGASRLETEGKEGVGVSDNCISGDVGGGGSCTD